MTSQTSNKAAVIETKKLAIASRMLALEPRYVFDAALADQILDSAQADVEVTDAMADSVSQATSELIAAAQEFSGLADGRDAQAQYHERPSGVLIDALVAAHNIGPRNTEIAFIDSRLSDLSGLIGTIPDGTRIVLIDGARDGVEQMVAALQSETGITGIHILSHGSEGSLQLGSSSIDEQSMAGVYKQALSSLQDKLSEGADILIYGCNFGAGASGERATALLAELTGADIASSDDLTGAEALGGDWVLEVKQGGVETIAIAFNDWEHTLAPMVISANSVPVLNHGLPAAGTFTGVGTTVTWQNAGTVDGIPIDLRATVQSYTGTVDPTFHIGGVAAGSVGDNPGVFLNSIGNMTLKWEVFEAGTSTYAVGSPDIRITDIDGIGGVPSTRETVTPGLNGLTAFTTNSPTNLNVTVSGSGVQVSGTQNQFGEASSLVGFTWQNVSSWILEYDGKTGSSYFSHDGDGEFLFTNAVSTALLGIDLDANNSTASGTSFTSTYTEGGAGIPVVDGDIAIVQNAALGTTLGSASIVLTNAQAGDVLSVGTLPLGMTSSIDTSVPGQITVTLTGLSNSVEDFQTGLQNVTFSNIGVNLSTTSRVLDVWVTNSIFGTSSNIAVSTIDINDPPVATPSASSGNEDTNIAVALEGTDVDGTVASVTVTSLPLVAQGVLYYSNGTTPVSTSTPLTVAEAASLVFVPATRFNGTVTIPFTVTDNGGATSASANEVITVNAVNDPPVADDAAITVDEASTNTDLGILAPTDVDGPASTITVTGLPSVGTVTLANGTAVTNGMTLTPAELTGLQFDAPADLASSTTTTFTYTVSDGIAPAVTGTATIIVNPVNDPPVAASNLGSGFIGSPVTIDILGNDTDIDNALNPASVQIVGTTTPGTSLVVSGQGTWSVNSTTGAITFTAEPAFTGAPTPISYTVADMAGDRSNAAAVSVMPLHAAPHLDLSGATPRTGAYLYGHNNTGFAAGWASPAGLARFDHVDPAAGGPGLTYTNDNSSGYVTGVASATLEQSIAQNEYISMKFETLATMPETWITETAKRLAGGNFQFAFAISDNNFASATLLSQDNLPSTGPVYDGNSSYVTAVAADYQLQPGTDYEVRVYFYNVSGGAMASFTWDDIYTSYSNDPTSYETTFTEGQSAVAIAAAAVQIEDANSANLVSGTITLTNKQADDRLLIGGAPLSAGSTGTISGITYTVTETSGTMSIALSGSATKAAYASFISGVTFDNTSNDPITADRTIDVSVNDGAQISNLATSTIHVNPVNDPPVATDGAYTTAENVPASGNAITDDTGSGIDSDIDGPALTLALASVGTFPTAQGGSITLAANGSFTYTPPANFNGTDTFNYSVTDGTLTDVGTLSFNVTPNEPPVLVDPAPGSGPEIDPTDPSKLVVPATDGTSLTLDLTPFFTDPESDPLVITPDPAFIPSWLSFDPTTNTFTGIPPADNTGDVSIPVTIDDGVNPPYNATVTIHPVNPGPAANDQNTTTGENVPLIVDLLDNDSDPDNDPLTVTSINGVTLTPGVAQAITVLNGTVEVSATGVITVTPAANFNGDIIVPYTIADQDGAISNATHTVSVSPNEPPVLSDPAPGSGPEVDPTNPSNLLVPASDGTPLTLDLTPFFADPENDALTITPDPASMPAWLSFDPATNTFTGTPPADNTGDVAIQVTIDDGVNPPYNATITIQPVNLGPVAANDTTATGYATPVTVNLLANDRDPDGDLLQVVAATVPVSQGTLTRNGNDWVFTPKKGFAGTATITYTIADGDGATSTATHTVTVAKPAIIAKDDVITGRLNTAVRGSVTGGDTYAPDSVFKIEKKPSVGKVTMRPDGSFVYTPKPGFAGRVTFTYRVTDPAGGFSIARATINVASQAHICLTTFGRKR